MLLGCVPSGAQIFSNRNFVQLKPGSDATSIARQAARVMPSPRQLRWQQLELTGFLHFGINTFTNKEWGDGTEDPKLFNPAALDAMQWVRICRDAGIRQVILTAKHHDGFCLWPSAYTDHLVKASPWKNGKGDVVREVADACHAYGIGFGVYLSPWDRHSGFFGDSARYNDYFVNQLTELLGNYGRVDEVWFDGANGEGPTGKKQVYDFDRWYKLIRKMQPGAVIAVMGPDVRWVGTETGYGRETEWSVVPADALVQEKIAAGSQKAAGFAPMNMMEDDLGSRSQLAKAKSLAWYPAEIDVSIRPGWFYHPKEDQQVKSVEMLNDIYFSSVGRNGVLLLNIPPDTRGRIHATDSAALINWKSHHDRSFATNLLSGSTSMQKRLRPLLDGRASTAWVSPGNDTTAVLEFRFPEPVLADALLLQEQISQGQRVERFEVDYLDGTEWKSLTRGTTIGHKRLLRFKAVKAGGLRVRILSSRLQPRLSELGLYKMAD